MKLFKTKRQKLGLLGENIVARFYTNNGFHVLHRNWSSFSGELDLVVSREPVVYENYAGKELRFVEIKSVSCENLENLFLSETKINPAEQFHVKKRNKMLKTITDYLIQHEISHETPWSVDLACVYINLAKRTYKLYVFKNCPLE